jgi:carbon-monoxide dehydrogenase small subunit
VSDEATRQRITFFVNDEPTSVVVHPMRRLLDTLREELGLTGSKEGCGEGECGACTVLIDGRPAVSCLVPMCQVEGRRVTTIEWLSRGARLNPVQQSFITEGGAQCGFCTPGMLMAAAYYIDHPDAAEDLGEALAGNQCRCTGYTKIFQAVEKCLDEAGVRADRPKTSLEGVFALTRVGEP